MGSVISRREMVRLGLASLALGACGTPSEPEAPQDYTAARLTARVSSPTQPLSPGRHALGLDGGRDGILSVPATQPAPFVLLLHGAGGSAASMSAVMSMAEELGMAALSVDSRSATWDVIIDGYGEDVAFIDSALGYAFAHVGVRATSVAAAGFSDGASYALSLALTNGDLFTHAIAWSPGFLSVPTERGKPHVFVTHGTQDTVLPIDATSRRIVPTLRSAGYAVTYEEFAGGHAIPAGLARTALAEV